MSSRIKGLEYIEKIYKVWYDMVILNIKESLDCEGAVSVTNLGSPTKSDFFHEHLIYLSNVHL